MFEAELIMGTTASGKSDYAVRKARGFHGIVLSIDSVSVYRQLNIGTAKPPSEILREIPHFCINIADIDKPFSAMDFRREALKVIEYAQKEEVPLFITAGSFFYLKALLTEPLFLPQTNPEMENNLQSRIDKFGLGSLYEELKVVDPKMALKIHPNDRYRIVRALAVYLQTGFPPSSFIKNNTPALSRPTWLGGVTVLSTDGLDLEDRIKKRTHRMLKDGLVDEVESLLKNDYQESARPLQSVGYREVVDFLKGRISKGELPDLIAKSTLKLAKRQRTWIRNGFSSILH